jgi:site-specific DNA recombinase
MNTMYDDEQKLDLKTLRYVMYLRKSTEDEGRQIRSIGDQQTDCEAMSQRLGLNVVSIIKEEKSAKKPNNRPQFSEMLKRMRAKEFDGIIAWHPDRLARNMVEAGRIIHMLDTDVIKDIQFVSHQFSNDANGKMLLGMLFVFSKHYSDDLSSKVTRGNRGNLRDFKSGGTPKHGYIRDDEGIYRTDGDNFKIMQRAWAMRASGKTIQEACDYINSQGYQKFFKKDDKGHQPFVMTDSVLSNIFKDTFYMGKLAQAGQVVDLVEAPVPFEPTVSSEIYFKVQEFGRLNRRSHKERKPFIPLRYMVFCDVCKYEKPMQVGRSRGQDGTSRLYYRCLNEHCGRGRGEKSIRGKLVFSEINRVIEEKLVNLPPEAYDKYLAEIKEYSGTTKTKLRSDLASARATKKGYEGKITNLSTSLGILSDKTVQSTLSEQIGDASQEVRRLEGVIKDCENKIERASLPKIDRAEFQDAISKMAIKLKKADVVQKDVIVSNLFLKLHFDHQKMTHYSLKEPFASLVELHDIQLGGGTWT